MSVAHRNGVIHRDIKPGNILLDEEKNVYLADFGIAKDLQHISDYAEEIEKIEADRLVGSPDYMSPEQIQLETLTPLADIYSLGIVLYILVTGNKPFEGSDLSTIISQHLYHPLPNIQEAFPALPDSIDDVIRMATEKLPEDRYENVVDLAVDFRKAIMHTESNVL